MVEMKGWPGAAWDREARSSNRSDNPSLPVDAIRRRVLQSGPMAALLCASGCSSPAQPAARTMVDAVAATARPGFVSVSPSTADAVIVPAGYRADVLYAWGDPVDGRAPAFRFDASNSADEQARQAGMHHDGMAFFPLSGRDPGSSGLLAINHEYVDHGLLFPDGMREWSSEKVRKSLAAHGVSIVHVERVGGRWRVVPGPYARRITAATPMRLSGPAAGHPLMRTADDPEGVRVLGTFANCAHGVTPWGTYLTCEENFDGYFGWLSDRRSTVREARYGLDARGYGNRWLEHEPRFDLDRHPNEAHRFGWVVEIDPRRPGAPPVKRSALGRFKHEGALVVLAADGRVVVYMGDDERNEYVYKFVSRGRFDRSVASSGDALLDDGTLYVARFDRDGRGRWLALRQGTGELTAAGGFPDQAHVVAFARQAADRVGATMLDRPEWIAHHPESGRVLVSLTGNSRRGGSPPSVNATDGSTVAGSSRPPVDGANPRPNNMFGHILSWQESGEDAAAESFTWEVFLLGGADGAPSAARAAPGEGDAFAGPDGLWVDPAGLLWIQTDMSASRIARDEFGGLGNNAMLACDVATRRTRRFLVGPRGCEVTGMTMTPDMRTLFVNVQHPGEDGEGGMVPSPARRSSNWPDHRADGRPRSATIVVTRDDGGIIGT
jgi:secreted PhoX family phosphatase